MWCVQPHEINFSSSLGKGLPKFQWLPSIDDVSRTIHSYHTASVPDEITEFESALVKLQQVGEKQKDHFAIFLEAPSIDQVAPLPFSQKHLLGSLFSTRISSRARV